MLYDDDEIVLRASEQDADDQDDEVQDGQAADDAADQDDAVDDAQDDQTADQADDADSDAADDVDPAQQQTRRKAIQRRADQTREPVDSVTLANQTAAATARAVADATTQSARQAEDERVEREAVAGMTDEQRATYALAKTTKNLQAGQAHTQLLLRSTSDQGAFTRTLNKKPQFAKYEDEVERRHQAILGQGGFTDRSTILAHLIGEKALKAENVKGQKNDAQRRVQAQRDGVQSRGARGDAGGGQRAARQGSSLVSKMERDNPLI